MVLVAIIVLLAAFIVPKALNGVSIYKRDLCLHNLRLIDAAKQQWALETNQPETAMPTVAALRYYIKDMDTKVVCPLDRDRSFITSYGINTMDKTPGCRMDPENHELP